MGRGKKSVGGSRRERRGRSIEPNESGGKGGIRIVFWNVAGIRNKDTEFWEFLKQYDVIGLTETWIEEKDWNAMKNRLPLEWSWEHIPAERVERKGRAKGGIMSGVRKEIEGHISEKRKGTIRRKIKVGDKTWDIFTIYNDRGGRDLLEEVDEWLTEEEEEESELLIGGDWNARIGREASVEEINNGEKRWSEDTVVNREGRLMLDLINKRGWIVLNGNKGGKEGGRWTFSRGDCRTVVDYGVTNAKSWDRIKNIEIGYRLDSDHLPILVELEGTRESMRKRNQKSREETKWIQSWKEEDVCKFERREEEIEWKETEGEEKWKDLKKRVDECCVKRKVRAGEKDKEGWFDEQCGKLKKKLQKAGRKKRDVVTLRRLRKKYRDLKKRKRIRWEEKMEKELKEIKNESEAWEFIRKNLRKRSEITDAFRIEEWKKHFAKELGEQDRKREDLKEMYSTGENVFKREPSDREIDEKIVKLKKKKAEGGDGIKNEAWIFGRGKIRTRLKEVIKEVWRGGYFIDDWREGIVTPIHKKGDKDCLNNYRGITLTSTVYKIYASILNDRIIQSVEEKGGWGDNQAGFRKEQGCMDNVYILRQMIEKVIKEKGKREGGLKVNEKREIARIRTGNEWLGNRY